MCKRWYELLKNNCWKNIKLLNLTEISSKVRSLRPSVNDHTNDIFKAIVKRCKIDKIIIDEYNLFELDEVEIFNHIGLYCSETLKYLDISGLEKINDNCIKILRKYQCFNVEYLKLNWLLSSCETELSLFINDNKNLETVIFNFCELSGLCFNKSNDNLKFIQINNCPYFKEDLIDNIRSSNKNLTSFKLAVFNIELFQSVIFFVTNYDFVQNMGLWMNLKDFVLNTICAIKLDDKAVERIN